LLKVKRGEGIFFLFFDSLSLFGTLYDIKVVEKGCGSGGEIVENVGVERVCGGWNACG